MSDADLIVSFPMLLEVIRVLIKFSSIDTADAVDYQVIVQMAGVDVCGDQHLARRVGSAHSRTLCLPDQTESKSPTQG